ncbi:MAG TPA: ABC-type transport auxiliary lipoprotein family protein [Rhizomicrobium sp.]|jgi:cholesterol transport system auxiliary component
MTAIAMRLSRRALVLTGGSMLTLGGCSNLIGPSAAPQIYRLEPVLPPASAGAPTTWQLAIARPETMHALDTERIALSRGAAMDYYADAEWNDTAPQLLQSLLVQAFEKNGRMAGVAAESAGLHADYLLATDIRDFEAQYDSGNGAPMVVVGIAAKLLDNRGKVLASLDARGAARANRNSVPDVVTAFDSALGAALAQIVGWTLKLSPP